MSLINCVNSAVQQGVISQQQGQQLLQQVNHAVNAHLAGGMANPQVVASVAAQQVSGNLRSLAAVKRLRVARQTQAHLNLNTMIDQADDVLRSVNAIFTPDWRDRVVTTSVEYRMRSVEYLAKSHYSEGLAQVEKTFRGEVPHEVQRNIYRELVGIATGDQQAKKLADGFRKSIDYTTDRYRMAGGAVGKTGTYDIPHVHDQYKVQTAADVLGTSTDNRSAWVDFVFPLLDRTKMVNRDTGAVLNDVELRNLLEGVWDTIRRKGYNTATSTVKGAGSTANKLDHERILQFKDDGWFEYNDKFGKRDIVNTAIHHVSEQSRNIALMETFGPNVQQGLQFLKNKATIKLQDKIDTAQNTTFMGMVTGGKWHLAHEERNISRYIDEWYDIATGNAYGVGDSKNGRFYADLRAMIASAQLGSAVISAVGDFGTMRWTARFNDLPQARLMKNYLDALFAGKSPDEARVLAGKMGLAIEHLQGTLIAHASDELQDGMSGMRVLADKVMRYSGLVRHTDAGRIAFSMTMSQHIAESFGKTFDQLDDGLRRGLERNGINANEWNIIRGSQTINQNGFDHVNLAALDRLDPEVAVKLHQYISSETDKALITAGWKFERTMQRAVGQKGELSKFIGMYKRYPILLVYHHLGRILSEIDRGAKGSAAAYGVGLMTSLTLLGAVATTLKDITSGRDPRDWFDPKQAGSFWMDSFIQGGAGGPLADVSRQFLDAVRQKRSSDAWTPALNYILGPSAKLVNDLIAPFWATLNRAVNDDNTYSADTAFFNASGTFGGEIAKRWTGYLPGNNLWFWKVAVDRYVEDGLSKMIDPKSGERFRRTEINRRKHYGDQEFWWRPGRGIADTRLPDWGSDD